MPLPSKRTALKVLALAALLAAGAAQAAGKYVLISHAPDSDSWWNTIKNAIKQAGEDYLRQSGLAWTIVQPVLLTDGPLTGHYRAAEHLALRGLPKISRADVAHFVLTAGQSERFVGKTVAISYRPWSGR